MKKYRVHLTQRVCADVEIEAENRADAEEKAMLSADLDWDSCWDSDFHVADVFELDEHGEEIS